VLAAVPAKSCVLSPYGPATALTASSREIWPQNPYGVGRQASGRRPQGAAALAASPSGYVSRFPFCQKPFIGEQMGNTHSGNTQQAELQA
jgi:hypothetical protein